MGNESIFVAQSIALNNKSLKNKVKEKEPMMRTTEDKTVEKSNNCEKEGLLYTAEMRKGGQNVSMNKTSREKGMENSTSEEERRKEGGKVSMRRTY